jgi:hypothetical protein
MDRPAPLSASRLPVLANHIYEYRKGVRHLFLHTCATDDLPVVLRRLDDAGIDRFVQPINAKRSNVYFGRPAFVATARRIVTKPLNRLTPEEDFILGTLLGYDREQQCERYLTLCKPAVCA